MRNILLFLFLFITLTASARSILGHRIPTISDAKYQIGEAEFAYVDKKEISILVWNAHKEGYEVNWQTDFNRLKVGSDFILLQEAIRRNGQLNPSVYSGLEGIVGESFYYDGVRSGNITLSKYHAEDSKLLHSPNSEPIIKTPKPVILTTYELENGQRLLMANIHGINFVGYRKFRNHIRQVFNSIKNFKGPMVWAGDFNTWSKRRTRYMNKMLKSLGLKKVVFRNSGRVKTFGGYPLDHFFVRGAEVLDANFPLIHSSDHNAMVVRLRL